MLQTLIRADDLDSDYERGLCATTHDDRDAVEMSAHNEQLMASRVAAEPLLREETRPHRPGWLERLRKGPCSRSRARETTQQDHPQ